jgi:hypothetical protein
MCLIEVLDGIKPSEMKTWGDGNTIFPGKTVFLLGLMEKCIWTGYGLMEIDWGVR